MSAVFENTTTVFPAVAKSPVPKLIVIRYDFPEIEFGAGALEFKLLLLLSSLQPLIEKMTTNNIAKNVTFFIFYSLHHLE